MVGTIGVDLTSLRFPCDQSISIAKVLQVDLI